MSLFSIDWDSWISLARELAGYLGFSGFVLRIWADRMDAELDREFEREATRQQPPGQYQVAVVATAESAVSVPEIDLSCLDTITEIPCREGRKLDNARRLAVLNAFQSSLKVAG